MNIFIVSRGYPTLDDPQWGCFERDQAIALQRMGHQIVFLSLDCRFRLGRRESEQSYRCEDGFHIYNERSLVPAWASDRLFMSFWEKCYSAKMLRLFEKAVEKHGIPDLLFVHYLPNIVKVRSIKDKYGIPIVAMEHWSVINGKYLPRYVYKKGKIAYKIPDILLTVSSSLQKRIKDIWGKESIVVHNMVGGEFGRITREERDSGFQFVSIGSIIHRKGFDLLVEAFDKTKLKNHNVRVVIIGDGKERNVIQNLIDERGLSEHFKLVGMKDKLEIVRLLSQSDAFVLPSRSETFGVVYIEAMMMGLPVIGTVCGGPEEFIVKENGILINSEDVNGLSNALEMMYDNISCYDREKIAEICREKFSPEVISRQLVDVFNQVVKNK